MELVESSSNFYLNCEQFNDSTEEVECSILIQDRDDILKRQDRWCVHVTRFAVDTQASLFYVAPDATATLDLELFSYRGSTAHTRLSKKKFFIDQRSFNLSKGAATLADLLDQMNDAVPALDHPDPDVHPDLSSPAGSDPNLLARCGQWAVTASGRFEFTAAITSAGKIKEPKKYAPGDDEFFVNIKMSESMRRVLGAEEGEIRVFGRESSLKTYRRLIDQIHTLLPSFRDDIKNWRWSGAANLKVNSDWYTKMYPMLSVLILDQVYFANAVNGQNHNVQVPATVGRPYMEQVGSEVSVYRHYWNLTDYFVSNFKSAKSAGCDSQHEKSQFDYLHTQAQAINGGHGTVDQCLFRADTIPGTNQTITVDHLYDVSANQGLASGVGAYKMNSKLSWGTWTRAFILGIPNKRQMYVNATDLTDLLAVGNQANLADGHVGIGLTPVVGDTLYIPDSGAPVGTGAIVHNRYQRAIIQSVEATTVVRATGKTADSAYLLTFDTELESNATRVNNLIPIENAGQNNHGVPRARVIWGTRRVPYQPLVYISTVVADADADNTEITFTCDDEFPVFAGDHVYVGHTFGSSTYAHEVHSVNYTTGAVTIDAGPTAQFAQDAVVFGFSQFFSVCHEHDSIVGHLTSPVNFISEPQGFPDPLIQHADVLTRVVEIMTYVERKKIPWNLTAVATQGIRNLTADELAAPSLQFVEYQSGNVTIQPQPGGIVRGTGPGNTLVAAALLPHLGANTFFDITNPITHQSSNLNLYPSHYFNLSRTDSTGPYADVAFRNFIT